MVIQVQTGGEDLRTKTFDKTVKGFATQMYKFKQAVSIVATSAWTNFFWRENPTTLTGPSGNAILGIPRGAKFPKGHPKWQQIKATIAKYGLEKDIAWEDIQSDDIDVLKRTLFRIAEGVVKAVDDEIWEVISEGQSATSIQSFTASNHWFNSSAKIIGDLIHAKQLIAEKNYPTEKLIAFISPLQHRAIVQYVTDKGAQFPSISNDAASNGVQGNLAGIKLIMSNSVTASFSLVVVPKICATWKTLSQLRTVTIDDPGVSTTVRSWEAGVTQLTDPSAIVLITATA